VSKFDRKEITQEELLQGLTPDEARAAAYYAGFNTDDEIHVRVREGWAAMTEGGRQQHDHRSTQAIPTMCQELVRQVFLSHTGSLRQYDLIGDKIIRYKVGRSQAESRTHAWTSDDEALVTHALSRPDCNSTTGFHFDWNCDTFEGLVTPPAIMWAIRRKNGTIYQVHPEHAYGFARQKHIELEEREMAN
jgi:hypothetical protein